MSTDETIVAIATPPGRGGIGVVRLSGSRALEIASSLIHPSSQTLAPQRATVAQLIDPESGKALDEVVATFFRGPHSYTGEDVAEITCHGAPLILSWLVEQAISLGARAAEPGEFTMRAFLNGRIDLTQAEAIRDLIEARTLYQARVAAAQMGGALSARFKPHKQALLKLIAALEAGIDFAEDDVSVMDWPEIAGQLASIETDLEKLAASFESGRIIREGLSLSIVGRPNVGKSSLFNRLLNSDRAIVTPIPGTTRDVISETASLDGIPLRLVDTAGIRTTADQVEKIGVERSHEAMADADLRLLVIDCSQEWTEEDSELLRQTRRLGAMLIAANKSDLPSRISIAAIEQRLAADADGLAAVQIASTSAITEDGLDELREKIVAAAIPGGTLGSEGEVITNLRHQQLLKASLAALARSCEAVERHLPHEMILLDLYEALRPLDEITGATDVEDVLGIIFSTFCVGK